MKKRKSKSWSMAYCGMAAALCVALMLLGTIIPIAMFIAPAVASFLIATVCMECGITMAWTAYAAVSLLGLLYEILAYHTFGSKDGMLMHIIHHKVRQVRCTAAISYAADDIIQFPVIRVVNAQRATGNTHCLILLFLFHTIVLCSHMGELSTIKILHYLCSVGQYLIVTAMNVDNNTCPRSILRFFSLVFHYRFILISNYSRLF